MPEISNPSGEHHEVDAEVQKFREYITALKDARAKDATLTRLVLTENLTEREMKVWDKYIDLLFRCVDLPLDLEQGKVIGVLQPLLKDFRSLKKEGIDDCDAGFKNWMNNRVGVFIPYITMGIEDNNLSEVKEAAQFEKARLSIS